MPTVRQEVPFVPRLPMNFTGLPQMPVIPNIPVMPEITSHATTNRATTNSANELY
jgi:hypothetical protein